MQVHQEGSNITISGTKGEVDRVTIDLAGDATSSSVPAAAPEAAPKRTNSSKRMASTPRATNKATAERRADALSSGLSKVEAAADEVSKRHEIVKLIHAADSSSSRAFSSYDPTAIVQSVDKLLASIERVATADPGKVSQAKDAHQKIRDIVSRDIAQLETAALIVSKSTHLVAAKSTMVSAAKEIGIELPIKDEPHKRLAESQFISAKGALQDAKVALKAGATFPGLTEVAISIAIKNIDALQKTVITRAVDIQTGIAAFDPSKVSTDVSKLTDAELRAHTEKTKDLRKLAKRFKGPNKLRGVVSKETREKLVRYSQVAVSLLAEFRRKRDEARGIEKQNRTALMGLTPTSSLPEILNRVGLASNALATGTRVSYTQIATDDADKAKISLENRIKKLNESKTRLTELTPGSKRMASMDTSIAILTPAVRQIILIGNEASQLQRVESLITGLTLPGKDQILKSYGNIHPLISSYAAVPDVAGFEALFQKQGKPPNEIGVFQGTRADLQRLVVSIKFGLDQYINDNSHVIRASFSPDNLKAELENNLKVFEENLNKLRADKFAHKLDNPDSLVRKSMSAVTTGVVVFVTWQIGNYIGLYFAEDTGLGNVVANFASKPTATLEWLGIGATVITAIATSKLWRGVPGAAINKFYRRYKQLDK